MTILESHQIAYRNTASKIYNFYPEDIEAAFEDFQSIVAAQGCTPSGPLFFSILSDPTAKVMTTELFLPVEEDYFKDTTNNEISFKSYFCINGMIMTRITGQYSENAQVGYWSLFDYIKLNDLEQRTPVFVEFKNSPSGKAYAEMSIKAFY
ncbi:DUF5085 family protein [Bacillus sp. MUM 13]|uniref:DUF5085 family protein n=1 Tax=Bacillus sp. MUM 13 TaxID=1678001 RepID=UPI0008F5EA5D|nr:DUF5085 family protein [Bacillus sp. MUM 13]OIK13881.1 DUF5085 domain-containing protein [Bacillus sp. MUM 13]